MATLCVLLPLIGSIIAGSLSFFMPKDKAAKEKLERTAYLISCGAMVLSAVFAIFVFYDVVVEKNARIVHWFTWIDSGAFEVSWALKLDTLTAVMLMVVCNISAIIHVYSIGYMHHDASRPRFFSYLSLFTFFMLMLVSPKTATFSAAR